MLKVVSERMGRKVSQRCCLSVAGPSVERAHWTSGSVTSLVRRPSSSVVELAVMSETDTISVSQLIELVRDRPVLWDRQKEVYKNRKLTRKAWVEICETLIENYNELGDQEQKAIGRSVISKWANLRDNWLRYWRKRQQLLLSGSSTTTLKKYIHHDQLLFLSKVYDPECHQEVEEIQVDVDVISDPEMDSPPVLSSGETSQNIWNFPEEEIKPPETDGHIYFFYSVLPLIRDFDNEQTIDFQMAIIECIKRIRVKAGNNQIYNPLHCQHPYQNQEPLPGKVNLTSTEYFSVHTQETAPKQKFCNSSFLETINDKKSVCIKMTDENSLPKLKTLSIIPEITESNFKTSQELSNLNKAICKLEKISKKISVSSLGDSYDHFGRYVVSLLRRLPPKKIQFIKKKIIKFISNHLVCSSKKLQIFASSPKKSQKFKESQDILRNHSNSFNDYQTRVNTLENGIESREDNSASYPCDTYQLSTQSSGEEPASSSYVSFSNNTLPDENNSPTACIKLNQTGNTNKRKKT